MKTFLFLIVSSFFSIASSAKFHCTATSDIICSYMPLAQCSSGTVHSYNNLGFPHSICLMQITIVDTICPCLPFANTIHWCCLPLSAPCSPSADAIHPCLPLVYCPLMLSAPIHRLLMSSAPIYHPPLSSPIHHPHNDLQYPHGVVHIKVVDVIRPCLPSVLVHCLPLSTIRWHHLPLSVIFRPSAPILVLLFIIRQHWYPPSIRPSATAPTPMASICPYSQCSIVGHHLLCSSFFLCLLWGITCLFFLFSLFFSIFLFIISDF